MDDDWSLPGYEVQGRLGDGTGEDLWRGRELDSGDDVVLCRLPADVAPATVQAWRREASRQALVASSHVLRLRAVVGHDRRTVLVRDHAAGGSLTALVARRGALEPGEVVTVGVAIADALTALHEAGIVGGGVSEDRVLFRPDGMPVLVVAVVTGARVGEAATEVTSGAVADPAPGDAADVTPGAAADGGDPASGAVVDVVALADLCTRVAGPRVLPELAAVLSAGRSATLSAPAFAAALRRTCPPAPVRRGPLPPSARPLADQPGPRHAAPAPSGRRPSSRALLAAVLVLLLLAGAAAGWWSGGSGTVQPGTAAAPLTRVTASEHPSSVAEWTAVLDRLDAARATAFAQADEALLAAVWVPGSAALSGDRRLVRTLADRGLTAHDVRHGVERVEVLAASAGHARLRVVDVLAAYEVRDAEGSVVRQAPARGEEAHVAVLRRMSDGWRLVEVRPD